MIVPATHTHLDGMMAIDPVASVDTTRKPDVRSAIDRAEALVYMVDNTVAGYITYTYNFFHHCFIDLVITSPSQQRMGIASHLIRYVISLCKSQKIFTSTNKSNAIAQALFTRIGFAPAGEIHGLDDDDSELFFYFDKGDTK